MRFGQDHNNRIRVARSEHLAPGLKSYRGEYDFTKQELRDLLREAVENTAKQQEDTKSEA